MRETRSSVLFRQRVGSQRASIPSYISLSPNSIAGRVESHHTVRDVHSIEREEISGPLRDAKGREDQVDNQRRVRTVIVEEDVVRTDNSQNVGF